MFDPESTPHVAVLLWADGAMAAIPLGAVSRWPPTLDIPAPRLSKASARAGARGTGRDVCRTFDLVTIDSGHRATYRERPAVVGK